MSSPSSYVLAGIGDDLQLFRSATRGQQYLLVVDVLTRVQTHAVIFHVDLDDLSIKVYDDFCSVSSVTLLVITYNIHIIYLTQTHTIQQTHIHTHIYTHTILYIYIYIYIKSLIRQFVIDDTELPCVGLEAIIRVTLEGKVDG